MSHLHYRKCEICGLKEAKQCGEKTCFARFPLREQVCKEWVRVVGKQDLAYVPIEKLHDLRHICGKHFEKRDLTKSKTRLKKRAIPKLGLTAPPLPDELLESFPLHIARSSQDSHKTLHGFPNPVKDRHRFNQWVQAISGDIIGLENNNIYKRRSVCHAHFDEKFCCRFNRLSNIAVPTLNIPGPLSLPKFTFEERRPLRPIETCAPSTSTSDMPSTSAMASTSVAEHELEETFQALQDSPDEQCAIDSEAPVEIQCDQSFSWQKSYQAESFLDLPVEVLELESGDADDKVKASVPEDNQCVPQGGDQLQCCECRRVIPEHSVRCVCVSCTDGDICSGCAADDKHSYHYAIRVPAIATQSEVRKVLQKIRRVLLEESVIKEEMKEEDDDPLSSTTHIVGDALYEDSISQVPNVDIQGCYRLPKSTQKMNRVEEIFKLSDEDPSEVFKGSSRRKRRISETQCQTDVPTQISKEPLVVLNPLENILKWTPSLKESEQNQDKRTFAHLKQKSQNVHKVNIGIMKRLLGKRIILQRLGQPQKEKPLTILAVPQEMKTVTVLGAHQKNELETNLDIIQKKHLNIKKIENLQAALAVQENELDTNLDIIQTKDLNIKKIEDLQRKRITLKRPAQTDPAREDEPSNSNETVKILPTKKIITFRPRDV